MRSLQTKQRRIGMVWYGSKGTRVLQDRNRCDQAGLSD